MIYRKHGTVARWENGTLIRVTESGIAIEEGDYFECRPLEDGREAPAFESGGVASALHALREVRFERLILVRGAAEHECEDRRWRDATDRVHASLAHGKLRALVDTTSEHLDDIVTIASVLKRAEETDRDAPRRLRLEPNVTAALLPHLVGHAPSNVRLVQTAGGVDGYGNVIEEAEDQWPNAYRPSYRARPVRIPLNLRLECASTDVDDDAPRAIALLAPVAGLTMRVLVVDGGLVYPATVDVDRIEAVATERVWYPYGGGSFGAAMML